MKDFGVFWGCTIQARFPFIEKSTRTVFEHMGLPYRDVDGFTCCPEKSLINNVDHGMYVLTAARNIALMDELGLDLVSPCTGCVSNLATVKTELKASEAKKAEINELLATVGKKYQGKTALRHLVPFFHDEVGLNKIKTFIKKPLEGMKIAIHYGCHMMRPSHALKNDDPLNPKKFDAILTALGAESVQHPTKLMCCGQGLDRVDQHHNAMHMARIKLKELKDMGTDAMTLCCPSCFLQFDNNQFLLQREGDKFDIPVFYLTDLMGLVMGLKPEDLGLANHRIKTGEFIKKWEENLALAEKAAPEMNETLAGENPFLTGS